MKTSPPGGPSLFQDRPISQRAAGEPQEVRFSACHALHH